MGNDSTISIDWPVVSVMIATYNSERVLERTLRAIRDQSYPQSMIEILIIDGGSRDNTIEIAQRYGCVILNNPKTDPVNAKIIGMKNAKGKYLITIDHDEVMTNIDSVKNKVTAMRRFTDCKVTFCSGYKCPQGFSGLNEYISEFGDPFSLFYYRFSKGMAYYYSVLKKRASLVYEDDELGVFCFDKPLDRILIELICLGTMIDLEYFRSAFDIDDQPDGIVHLFYNMVKSGDNKAIIIKDDPLEHYSVDSLNSYLPKLRWRIVNNVHYADRAAQGFTGRSKQVNSASYRKYLFPLYSVSTIIPFAEGVFYSITRKNRAFLLHPFLCWYVTVYVVYQYLKKITGRPPVMRNYDGSTMNSVDG